MPQFLLSKKSISNNIPQLFCPKLFQISKLPITWSQQKIKNCITLANIYWYQQCHYQFSTTKRQSHPNTRKYNSLTHELHKHQAPCLQCNATWASTWYRIQFWLFPQYHLICVSVGKQRQRNRLHAIALIRPCLLIWLQHILFFAGHSRHGALLLLCGVQVAIKELLRRGNLRKLLWVWLGLPEMKFRLFIGLTFLFILFDIFCSRDFEI